MKLSRFSITIALGAVAVLLAGCASGTGAASQSGVPSASGGNKTINIGYFPVVSPIPIMKEQAELTKAGYKINWVEVDSGLPGAASALAAGKLDMAFGNSASASVIFSASPNAAYFVGQSFVDENITVVADRSGITSRKEVTGKKVVVSGLKTASTLFFEIGLKKAGVDVKSNQYFVSGTGPGMVGVLDSGGADVAATYVPYSADMVQKGIGKVLFTASDALGFPAPGDGFIASQSFAKSNPAAVKAVLKAQFDATDYIKSNPSKAYAAMAKFASVPTSAVKYSFEHKMVSIASTYAPDKAGLEKVATLAQSLGYAKDGVNLPEFVKTFVRTDFAKDAAQ